MLGQMRLFIQVAGTLLVEAHGRMFTITSLFFYALIHELSYFFRQFCPKELSRNVVAEME